MQNSHVQVDKHIFDEALCRTIEQSQLASAKIKTTTLSLFDHSATEALQADTFYQMAIKRFISLHIL